MIRRAKIAAGWALRAARTWRWHSWGRCNICGQRGPFLCFDPTAARGEFRCVRCRSFSRKRHVAQLLLAELGQPTVAAAAAAGLERDVYSATASDALWRFLGSDPRYTGSEFFPDVPLGAPLPAGGVCQDLERLTFPDGSFDVVLSEDVLEHVRYPDRAFAEIARVLRPGGVHIWTVPLMLDRPTVERVRPVDDGDDELLCEPEWHLDLVHGRALAYRTFGVDLFDRLPAFGFDTSLHMAALPDRSAGIVDSYVLVSRRR